MDAFHSSPSGINTATTIASLAGGTTDPDDPRHTILDEDMPVVPQGLDGGWFGKVGTTVSLLFGTFGNAMTVIVLRRLRSGWSAMNVYLTALALSDTAMLYSGALPIWSLKVLAYDVYASHVVVCKLGIWVMSTSSVLSAWLLVALTAQRAASVVWPHRINVICTRHKSVVIVVIITLSCSLLYSHTVYGFNVVTLGNGTSERCTFASAQYERFWVSVFVNVDLLAYSVLPCACLVLSNSALGWKLAVAVQEARGQFSAGREDRKDSRRKKAASSATVTIIIVSAAFVVITIPLMIYNTFYHSYTSEDAHTREIHHFLYDFFFVFGFFNFSWNFYLYCLTGSRFRAEFKKIVFGCCLPAVTSAAESSACVTERSHVSGEGGTRGQEKVDVENNDDF